MTKLYCSHNATEICPRCICITATAEELAAGQQVVAPRFEVSIA